MRARACVRAGVGEQTRALLHFDVAVAVAADPNVRTDAWVAWVPAHEPRVSTRAAAATMVRMRLSRCAPQRTPERRMFLAEYATAPVQDAAPCASMESPCAGSDDNEAIGYAVRREHAADVHSAVMLPIPVRKRDIALHFLASCDVRVMHPLRFVEHHIRQVSPFSCHAVYYVIDAKDDGPALKQ